MNRIYDPDLIAKRVRFVREQLAGKSIRDFAEDLQTTPASVRRWERGQDVPCTYFLFMICFDYHVSANWLLGLSNRR